MVHSSFSPPYQVGIAIIVAEALWAVYWFVTVVCQVILVPKDLEGFEYHTELALLLFHPLAATMVWSTIEHRKEEAKREFGPLIFMIIALLSDLRSILVISVRLHTVYRWAWNMTLAGACVGASLSICSIVWYVYIMRMENNNKKKKPTANSAIRRRIQN